MKNPGKRVIHKNIHLGVYGDKQGDGPYAAWVRVWVHTAVSPGATKEAAIAGALRNLADEVERWTK